MGNSSRGRAAGGCTTSEFVGGNQQSKSCQRCNCTSKAIRSGDEESSPRCMPYSETITDRASNHVRVERTLSIIPMKAFASSFDYSFTFTLRQQEWRKKSVNASDFEWRGRGRWNRGSTFFEKPILCRRQTAPIQRRLQDFSPL